MAIPQAVMAHVADAAEFKDSAPVCMQHLLDLWANTLTVFALERHPELQADGRPWTPSAAEAAELNSIFIEVNVEQRKHHPHVWFKDITYNVDTSGLASVYIPDEYEPVMEYLVAVRSCMSESHHSAIPQKATKQ